MSDSKSKAPHQPGVYVKGDSVKIASSPSRAVALAFAGYVRQADEVVEAPADETPVVESQDAAPVVETTTKTETTKVEAPKPTPPNKPKDS